MWRFGVASGFYSLLLWWLKTNALGFDLSAFCVGRQCIGRRCSRLLRKMLTYVEEEEVQSNEALLRLGQRD
jgi:hypothetical protein